jgi:Zn-finger nucleic acid-binding protein
VPSSRTAAAATISCPDCKLELEAVPSGSVLALRCRRCRGIWLDPESFRRLCEEEARPPDEETALAPAAGRIGPRPAPAAPERIRYRPCPTCREVMSRTNFGKVSGVVIDVCRPHGAWFDRGELAAIRRFLRAGGLRRYERIRDLDRERERRARAAPPVPMGAPVDDVYDVLVGGSGWDVPSRIPRLLVAAVCGALGVWGLWRAFHPDGSFHRDLGTGPLGLGLVCLYLAWRAAADWATRRR